MSTAAHSTSESNRSVGGSVSSRQTSEALRRLGAAVPERAFRPAGKTRQLLELKPGAVAIVGYALQIPFSLKYSMTDEEVAASRADSTTLRWNDTHTEALVYVNGAAVATILTNEVIAAYGATTQPSETPLELTLRDDRGQSYLVVIHSLGVGLIEDAERLEYMQGSVYLSRASLATDSQTGAAP